VSGWPGLSGRQWRLALVAGTSIGVVYVLSPLAVWFAVAAFSIAAWAEHGVEGRERQWLRLLLAAAIVLRVLSILTLFASANHSTTPFATFFGDEEFFIKRSIWLRNLALGVPIHPADFTYAFDEVGQTSYLYLLAAIQVLAGPAPYGVHLVGIAFYVATVVLLFRLARRTLGRAPAFIGLVLLLFLPTLFVWSVSALKEPAFLLLSASALALVEVAARRPEWGPRLAAAGAIAVLIPAVESVRRAGALLTAVSLAAGIVIAWIAVRPRALMATIVLVPIALGAAFGRPEVQVRAYDAVTRAAFQHRGHIFTPGYVYKALDDRFYISEYDIPDMRFFEQARFVIRSLVAYVAVPLPSQASSRTLKAYMPEQLLWYVMIALVPVGFVGAVRRDSLVASLFLAFAAASASLVALVSGNVGTLVRHRGLVIPFVVWLSAVGGVDLWLRWRHAGLEAETRMEEPWP
jgi:hypothetical protein